MTPTVALLAVIATAQVAILVCEAVASRQSKRAGDRADQQLRAFVSVIERALKLEPGRIAQDIESMGDDRPTRRKRGPVRDLEAERREAIAFAARNGLPMPLFAPPAYARKTHGDLEESEPMPGGRTA